PAIAVNDLDEITRLQQIAPQPLADRDAAMFPAGAADADREVTLHLFFVLRREIADEVVQPLIELFIRRLLREIFDYFRIEPGLRPQLFDEMRIRKEAHIEEQIEVVRRLIL